MGVGELLLLWSIHWREIADPDRRLHREGLRSRQSAIGLQDVGDQVKARLLADVSKPLLELSAEILRCSGGPSLHDARIRYPGNASGGSPRLLDAAITEWRSAKVARDASGHACRKIPSDLHRSSKEAPHCSSSFSPPSLNPGPADFSGPMLRGGLSIRIFPTGKGKIEASSVSIATFISLFPVQDGRVVVDKTGMKGLYDIPDGDFDLGPFELQGIPWPEILQQLGFKLESARGPVEVLVVDRLEKPTEN
jgi:hypothetical protein